MATSTTPTRDAINRTFAEEAKRIEGTYPVGGPKRWVAPKVTRNVEPQIATEDIEWNNGRPIAPEGFDYEGSPVNILGNKLPEHALHWLPNGIDPYWGEGFAGFFNRTKSTWGAEVRDDIDYDLQWQESETPYAEMMMGAGQDTARNNRQFLANRIGDFLQNTNQGEGERPGFFTRATRTSKIIVDGVLSGLDAVAQGTKMVIGTNTLLAERGEEAGMGTALTFEDVEQSFNMPEISSEQAKENIFEASYYAASALARNRMARSAIAGIFNFVTLPWNTFLAQKFIRRTAFEQGFDVAREERDRALNASRMAYTAFSDASVKGEYLRRLDAGEDPIMLKYELQDPLQEMVGELIFDPLNLSFGPASGAKKLANAVDEVATPIGRIADAVRDLDNASDVASMAEKTENLFQAVQDGRRAVLSMTDDLSRQRGIRALTAGSKRAIVARRTGDVMRHILSSSVGPDQAIDIFKALVNVGSDNATVAKEAFAVLSDSNLSMNILTSRAGNELGIVLGSLLDDGGDALRKLMGGFGDDVTDLQRIEQLTDFFDKRAGKVIDDLFPTIPEAIKAGEEVDWITRSLAGFNDKAQKGVVGAINKFFANVYMGLSPGYAFRNAITNTLHVFVDHGARPFTKTPTMWLDNTNDLLGFIPASMKEGFGPARALPTNVNTNKKLFGIFPSMLEASARMEQRAGARVMGKVIEDTMMSMMRPGRAIPDITPLVSAGMSREAANALSDLIIRNRGNVGRAVREFKGAFATGSLDMFSTGRWISEDARQVLRSHGLEGFVDDVLGMRAENANVEDVINRLDEIFTGHEDNAMHVVGESSALDDLEDVMPHMAEAAEEGHVSQHVAEGMTNRYAANSAAIEDYSFAADNILRQEILKAAQSGNNALVDELTRIHETYKAFLGGSVAANVKNKSRQFTSYIWDATREIRELPRNTDWGVYWNKYLKELGEIPADLTKKRVLNELWDNLFRNTQKKRWEKLRDMQADIFEQMIQNVSASTGTDLMNNPLLLQARATIYNARKYDVIDVASENLMYIYKGADYFSPGTFEIQMLAARMGIPTVGESGKMIPGAIDNLVNIINRNLPEGMEPFSHIQDIEQLRDIPLDVAKEALFRHYGISEEVTELSARASQIADEFGDIVFQPINQRLSELAKWIPDEAIRAEADDAIRAFSSGETTADELRVVLEEIFQRGAPEQLSQIELRFEIPVVSKAVEAPVPELGASTPSFARAQYETLEGVRSVFEELKQSARNAWETQIPVVGDDMTEAAITEWARLAEQRIGEARVSSVAAAEAARDFTLIGYGTEKQNLDLALSYMYPYQFWYRKTYQNWMKRIVTRPGVVAAYAKYKDALSQVHAGMPDWWKNNINTNELFGLDWENPLYFNLEATLNPLNGLTGVDFEDPYKKVDWWSTTLHQLGTFGPSTWTPLSIATAISMSIQGEEEAAARWAGRLFPQTATIKAATSLLNPQRPEGILGNFITPGGVELDPFVHMFSGGIDPYERRRIGRALGALFDRGDFTPEQIMDAAYNQTGEAWDSASQLAADQRDWGQLFSFFGGVGFKARNASDMEVDRMYTEYFGLWAQEPDLSPDELRMGLDNLRAKYPFMDAVLLSRKGGVERDRAYAYNVMGRIAPGQKNAIAEAVGIPGELLSRFYDDKGHIENWTESERMRFMAGMIEIGAALQIPSETTRAEWGRASSLYGDMMDTAESIFGEDALALVDIYFGMKGTTQAEKDAANAFLDANPVVGDYLDWRAHTVTNTPELSTYYGGIEQIQDYFNGAMYNAIERELGTEIWSIREEYYRIKDEGGDYRAYYNAHRQEFERYYEIKDEWQERIDNGIVSFGARLEDALPSEIREDVGDTVAAGELQETAAELAQPQTIPPDVLYRVITSYGGEELLRLTLDEDDLPDVAVDMLETLAGSLGMSLQDFLQQVR